MTVRYGFTAALAASVSAASAYVTHTRGFVAYTAIFIALAMMNALWLVARGPE